MATGDILAVRINGTIQRSVTDGAITSGTATFTSATASFTSADVGREIDINGAGAAGAMLATTISVVTNATTVTVVDSAGTTVTGATTIIGVTYNGWVADIDISGLSTGGTYAMGMGTNNDPSAAKIVFSVTRPGYSSTAVLGTVVDTLYGTKQIRRPYPNNAVNAETLGAGFVTVRVALSDYIYSGDTVTVSIGSGFYTQGGTSNNVFSGAVTNNSTMAYSATKAVGRWVAPVQYSRVTGNFTLEAVIFNRFARNGKPLAAVQFACSDAHSHTSPTVTVTDMTKSTLASTYGDQNTVLVYAATVDVSTLTQGDVLTCNFKAYPWAGDATAVLDSNSGVIQPNAALSDLLLLNDKAGTYGGGFAVVDPVNGQTSAASTWVSATQSAAETAYSGDNTLSYKDISYAVAAIKAWNNANLARNNASGGTILVSGLNNDPNGHGNATENCGTDTYLTVTHLSTATRATAGFNTVTNASALCQRIRYYDLSFSGAIYINASSAVLWLDGDSINTSYGGGTIFGASLCYATNNSVTAMPNGFGWQNGKRFQLVRGNSALANLSLYGDGYALIGNSGIRPLFQNAGDTDNAVIAFNSAYSYSSGWWADTTATLPTKGVAVVQNVVETLNGASQLSLLTATTANASGANNAIVWNNTLVGGRDNMFYNDYGTGGPTPFTNVSMKGNTLDTYSIKGDIGALYSGATGDFAQDYGVGFSSNWTFATGGPTFDPTFFGLNSILHSGSLTSSYVNCAAYGSNAWGASGCSNLGNGDYHLTATATALNLVPAGGAVLPYDIAGTARKNDGTGSAGAYEYAVLSDSLSWVGVSRHISKHTSKSYLPKYRQFIG